MARRLIEQVRRALVPPDGGGLTDGQLLGRYVAGRDGDAFAALVRRHGPMVWGVCRRVLGDPHDAEDAFQAAFLVLAGKAGSVRRAESLGAWLHRVARQLALRARGRRDRRRQAESSPPGGAAPP